MKLYRPQVDFFTLDEVDTFSFCIKLYQAESYKFSVKQFKHHNKNRFRFLALVIQISKYSLFIEFPYRRLKENE